MKKSNPLRILLGIPILLGMVLLLRVTGDPRSAMSLVGGVILAGLGYWGLYGVARSNHLARRSSYWMQTPGRVVSVDFKQVHKSSMGAGEHNVSLAASYFPIVSYEYQVYGEQYTSTRLDFSAMEIAIAAEDREAFQQEWFIGKGVDVYYNPDRPQQAVLTPGASEGSAGKKVFATCFCLLLALGGSWLLYYGVHTFKWVGLKSGPARHHAAQGTAAEKNGSKTPVKKIKNAKHDEQGIPVGDPAAPSLLKDIDLSGTWHLTRQTRDLELAVELNKTSASTYEATSEKIINMVGVYHIRGDGLVKERRVRDNYWDMVWTWRSGYFEMTSGNYTGWLMYRPGEQPDASRKQNSD